MASTAGAGDAHSLPPSPATSPTAFLDDHPIFLDQTTSPSFYLPAGVAHAAAVGAARDHHPPSFALPQASAAAGDQRKPPPPTPRKRPRAAASRRPPTTVLTTDPSNFRAMVQEFTGFPSPPPFSALMPSPHFFSGAGSSAPATCAANTTTSLVLDALALLAKTRAIAAGASAAAPPSSGSELYGGYGPELAGAGTFDGGFEAADGENAGGNGLFSSTSQYAGERRY